jgi:hypothetical protein
MPCDVLETILQSEKIISNCYLDRELLETIYIVDTTNTFEECTFNLLNKEVILMKSSPYTEKYDSIRGRPAGYPAKEDRFDVFKCIKIANNDYKLVLLRERGGNVINCYFSLKEGNVEVEKIEMWDM